MGRSIHDHAKRLTEAQEAELDLLRERCALLDAKGKTGTCHHEMLARLEASAAAPAPVAPKAPAPSPSPAAPED